MSGAARHLNRPGFRPSSLTGGRSAKLNTGWYPRSTRSDTLVLRSTEDWKSSGRVPLGAETGKHGTGPRKEASIVQLSRNDRQRPASCLSNGSNCRLESLSAQRRSERGMLQDGIGGRDEKDRTAASSSLAPPQQNAPCAGVLDGAESALHCQHSYHSWSSTSARPCEGLNKGRRAAAEMSSRFGRRRAMMMIIAIKVNTATGM